MGLLDIAVRSRKLALKDRIHLANCEVAEASAQRMSVMGIQ